MRDLSKWTGRPTVMPVRLEGRYVIVEPFLHDEHLQDLWDALGGMAINPLLKYFSQDDFGGIGDFAAWLQSVQKSGWVTHVFRDKSTDKIAGMANYMRTDAANGVTEVGGVAHGAAMARSPLSTEVHYLMARHVFEELDYRRYEWKCHNGNAPSKKTAARLGFTFEGVFRQHIVAKGKNRDTAWFSMIDSEWPSLKAAFETWLSPENFDADGRQQQRLEDIRDNLAHRVSA